MEMSSFVLAQIAQRKQEAVRAAQAATRNAAERRGAHPLRSSATLESAPSSAPAAEPMRTMDRYVEALAALIPAEVLTLHAFTLSMTTRIVNPESKTADHIANALSAPGASAPTDAAAVAEAVKNATVTVISAPDTLRVAFWALVVFSLLLYLVPRGYAARKASPDSLSGWHWYRAMSAADWIRAAIPPLSFVAWTMLQRTTAFDAAFPGMSQPDRSVSGMFLAVVLIAVAAWVAFKPEPDPLAAEDGGHDADHDVDDDTRRNRTGNDQRNRDKTIQDEAGNDPLGNDPSGHDQKPTPSTGQDDTTQGAAVAGPNPPPG
jgi:hypothetical protein